MLFNFFKSNSLIKISLKKSKLLIKNKKIKVFIADDPIKRGKGLKIFDSIDYDEGMLFVYPGVKKPRNIMITMNGMKFDIDILWIKNKKIIYIIKNAKASNLSLLLYKPKEKAHSVLEVKSGFVNKNKIKVGDNISVL